MDEAVDTLDFLYEQSLDEQLGEKDLSFIMDAMDKIAGKCDMWLNSGFELTGEAKMRFAVLRKMANDTAAEIKKGYDVLLHWAKMRDYIVTLMPAIRAFEKVVDKKTAV